MSVNRLLLVAALIAGCGDRRLDLALALARDSCTVGLPAGGSLLYQIDTAPAGSDGGGASFCGGCLAVDQPLADADAILAFLRTHAPSCAGVPRGADLRVALTAYTGRGCPDGGPRLFCSLSPPVPLPDGLTDAVVSVVLTCDLGCTSACKPSSCLALGKNCGTVSDGCVGALECGKCMPPLQCGGHGTGGVPNVCSK